MKHYSGGGLDRAARAPDLQTNDELKQRLRARLDGTSDGKRRLAKSMGITEHRLTLLLRSAAPVPDKVAAALGYRTVTRFERTG